MKKAILLYLWPFRLSFFSVLLVLQLMRVVTWSSILNCKMLLMPVP
ncbi:hypothetical protein MCEZLEM10_00300 [Methylophilaceae bacterium]